MKQPRRKFSADFKAAVALEAIKGIKTISEIAQHYKLHPVQVSQWKTDFLAHSSEDFEGEKKYREEIEQLKAERDELFKQIGEHRFQNEWLKKTSSMSTRDCRALVDVSDLMVTVSEQCKWQVISRSGFYYRSHRISSLDLSAMQALDRLYLETPHEEREECWVFRS